MEIIMKKKYLILSFILLIIILIPCAIFLLKPKVKVSHLQVSIAAKERTSLEDLASSSQLIIEGKAKKITPAKISDVIFTNYEIDVKEVLKDNISWGNQKVIVSITGGTIDGEQQILDFEKQLEKRKNYIFCLRKVYPENPNDYQFSSAGISQGTFEIDDLKNGSVKIKPFNPLNNIENNMLNQVVSKQAFIAPPFIDGPR
jgi:hypothetical protein